MNTSNEGCASSAERNPDTGTWFLTPMWRLNESAIWRGLIGTFTYPPGGVGLESPVGVLTSFPLAFTTWGRASSRIITLVTGALRRLSGEPKLRHSSCRMPVPISGYAISYLS